MSFLSPSPSITTAPTIHNGSRELPLYSNQSTIKIEHLNADLNNTLINEKHLSLAMSSDQSKQSSYSSTANGNTKTTTINSSSHRTPFQIDHLAISSSRNDNSPSSSSDSNGQAISPCILPQQQDISRRLSPITRVGNTSTTDQPLDMSKNKDGLSLPQMQQLQHLQEQFQQQLHFQQLLQQAQQHQNINQSSSSLIHPISTSCQTLPASSPTSPLDLPVWPFSMSTPALASLNATSPFINHLQQSQAAIELQQRLVQLQLQIQHQQQIFSNQHLLMPTGPPTSSSIHLPSNLGSSIPLSAPYDYWNPANISSGLPSSANGNQRMDLRDLIENNNRNIPLREMVPNQLSSGSRSGHSHSSAPTSTIMDGGNRFSPTSTSMTPPLPLPHSQVPPRRAQSPKCSFQPTKSQPHSKRNEIAMNSTSHQSDSDIDEHFRRSLGKNYNELLASKNRKNANNQSNGIISPKKSMDTILFQNEFNSSITSNIDTQTIKGSIDEVTVTNNRTFIGVDRNTDNPEVGSTAGTYARGSYDVDNGRSSLLKEDNFTPQLDVDEHFQKALGDIYKKLPKSFK